MLARLAPALVRRRRLILIVSVVVVAIAGIVGGGVAKRLTGGGFDDPGSESSKAKAVLQSRFGQGEPNLVFVVRADSGKVDDATAAAAGRVLTQRLAQTPGVAQASSYWSLGSPPPLKSKGGDKALVLARVSGNEDQARDRGAEIANE